MKLLTKAGHDPIYQSSKKKRIKEALQREIDLVLVAGGDGSVGSAADVAAREQDQQIDREPLEHLSGGFADDKCADEERRHQAQGAQVDGAQRADDEHENQAGDAAEMREREGAHAA